MKPRITAATPTLSPFRRFVVWCTLVAFVAQPVAASAQVVAAAAGSKPTVTTAPNGVTLVQIVAPTAGGVSRNQYQQFDVSAQGVILNNSVGIASTQLGGWIEGNANLANGPARIILNEVVSALPSNLRGYTEVAGSKAEVIIANPNGITCNGCGFINTTRGVLTTGTPVFGGDGSLSAFRVTGGNITIAGTGLNSTDTDQVDLIASAVQVNAGIWAKQINVVAGANQVAYADLATTSVAGSGAAPSVAIDVAALGGMYANKIRLVGTEAGVGVVNAGNLVSAGDISITSAGRIVLSGTTQAAGNLDLSATQDIANSGTAYAAGNASLTAASIDNTGTFAARGDLSLTAGSVTSAGTLAAGAASNGSIDGSGNLSVATAGDTTISGSAKSGGSIRLDADNLILAGSRVQAGAAVTLAASTDIDARSASITAGTTVSVSARQLDNRQGLIGGIAGLTVSADSIDNRQGELLSGANATFTVSGALNNAGGTVAADGNIAMTAATLNNAAGSVNAGVDLGIDTTTTANGGGTLSAGRDLTHRQRSTGAAGAVGTQSAGRNASVVADGSLTLASGEEISAATNLDLTVADTLTSAGKLTAGARLGASATDLTLQSGSAVAAGTANLTASATLANAGGIDADTVTLTANRIDNTRRIVGDDITLTAATFNNSGSNALVGALNDLTVNADTVTNENSATLYAVRDLAIRGQAGGQGGTLTNSSAIVEAGRDLGVNMATVNNVRNNTTVTPEVVSSLNLYYKAYGDIWPSDRNGTNYYLMYSPLINGYERERWVDVTVTRDTATGLGTAAQMQAGRHASFTAQNLTNTASLIAAAGTLTANVSGTLANTGISLYESESIVTHHLLCVHYPSHSCQGGRSDVYTTDTTNTLLSSVASTLQGATAVTLNTGTLTQTNANPRNIVAPGASGNLPAAPGTPGATASAIAVPAGGLYATHTAPNATYLVETDPRFASRSNFVSSDAFLSKLGLAPAALGKRLGDGYVEAMAIRDQLFSLTGRRFLPGYRNESAQLLALYDAGAGVAQRLQLVPGVALTAAQIAALTTDILWLQKERVVLANGEAYEVQVPRLYLAQLKDRDLSSSGALIAGGQVELYAANDLHLEGGVQSDTTLTASATNLVQRAGRLGAGTRIDLSALKDLAVLGGRMAAEDIALAAGQNLVIERQSSGERFKGSLTEIQEAAPELKARNNLTAIAGQDIALKGADLAAGNDLTLAAGRNLDIAGAARNEDWQTAPERGQGSNGANAYRRQATVYTGSKLVSGNDVTLLANNTLTVQGSTVEAGNSLSASAADIGLLASLDRESVRYELGSPVSGKGKGAYAKGESDTATSTVSQLTAKGSIALTATNTLASEGARVKAGEDIDLKAGTVNLDVANDTRQSSEIYRNVGKRGQQQADRQEQSAVATGTILEAGNTLRVDSTGNTRVVGGALSAGEKMSLVVGGDLALIAAQSSLQKTISAYSQNSRKATTLSFSQQEVRQLLTTITVGGALDISVGGNFSADTGERKADGTLNADRMTTAGIEKGDSRQQVSVTRSGVGADANPTRSQVLGDLKAQGIRNGAGDSFSQKDAATGQAALQQYLQSGLVSIRNDPQLTRNLGAILKNSEGATLTVKDANGNLSLTVAGQAKVQEVYNTLKLSETFDTKKFANQGTAQIVTLVAAIVLTVCTGGAGAGTLGAFLAEAGSTAAAMINAAVIGMGSTMVGQLAGGASFGEAFQVGVKAGAVSAFTAGIASGVNEALGINPQLDANGNVVKDAAGNIQYQTEFGAQYAKLGAFEKLGTGTFWAQTGANAGAQGLASVATGGKFGQGALGGLGSAIGGNFNTAVGDWAQQNGIAGGDWSKMLLHAGIGGAQAALTGKDALAGAIGGATAEALSPFANELDKATGNKAAGELLSVAGSIAANQLLNRNARASDLTAAYQALQTDRMNRQLHTARQQTFGASGKSRLIDKGAQPLKEGVAEIAEQYREATGCQRGAPCEKTFWSEIRDMQAPFILAKDDSAAEQTKNLIAYLGSPFADAYKNDAALRGEVDRRIAQAPDSRVVDVGDLLGYANQLGYQRAFDTARAAHATSTAPEAEKNRQIELTAMRLMRQDESGTYGTQNTQQTLERAKTEETAAMLLGAWAAVRPVTASARITASQQYGTDPALSDYGRSISRIETDGQMVTNRGTGSALGEEMAGSIRNVNPGYPTAGRTQNCVNCSVATDATLSGNPATALPSTGPVSIRVLEQQYGGRFSAPTTSSNIEQQLLNAGDGARGIVFGSRGPNETGHVFNVVNQNGVVRFLDGQTGQPATFGGYQSFHLLRTN